MSAEFCDQFIARHGSLFKVTGVQLVCKLHASSWVTYGWLDSAIIVRVGGRQVCVSGSMVFNTPYALALMALSDELLSKKIVMRTHSGCNSTKRKDGSMGSVHHILDATFVDECSMVAAEDPESLASATDCCTLVLSATFQLLKLEVNGRPGTECLVQMVGKHGRDIVERWRCDDGSLSIPEPPSDRRINAVDHHRHLGTIVMADGNDVPNVRLCVKGAKEEDRWRCEVLDLSPFLPR